MAEGNTTPLPQFLEKIGANNGLNWDSFKSTGLDIRDNSKGYWVDNTAGSLSQTFGDAGVPDTQQQWKLSEEAKAKFKDYSVRLQGEDSNFSHYTITNPSGKTMQTKVKKQKDSWFDSFLYSGGPIALMAGPIAGPALGSALGLSGTAATAVGTGLVNAGITGAATGSGKAAVRSGLAAGVPAALTAIPGFSGLSTPVQAAAKSAVGAGIASKGDPRAMLLSALLGGASPAASSGMQQAGMSPAIANFVTALLRGAVSNKAAPVKKP